MQLTPVLVLQDDGCNPNVVYRQFVSKKNSLFDIVKKKVQVKKSQE